MKVCLPDKDRGEVGERVRLIRTVLKLDQANFGKRVGLSQPIICQYETGQTEVSLSFLKFLKQTYKVSSDFVLFGEGDLEGLHKGFYLGKSRPTLKRR